MLLVSFFCCPFRKYKNNIQLSKHRISENYSNYLNPCWVRFVGSEPLLHFICTALFPRFYLSSRPICTNCRLSHSVDNKNGFKTISLWKYSYKHRILRLWPQLWDMGIRHSSFQVKARPNRKSHWTVLELCIRRTASVP